MTMKMPKTAVVDVLIPAYNAASTIAASIGSIQRQTLSDLRIVVVDDGSTDGTAEILAGLQRGDDRIRIVSRENGGIVDALNDGLKVCTAALIARHDADDVAHPRRLESQVAYLAANPDCVAVDCSFHYVDEAGVRNSTFLHEGEIVSSDAGRVPAKDPYLMHPFMMMRLEAVLSIKGYRYAFNAEDVDLCWRLSTVGQLRHVPEVLADYTISHQGIMSSSVLNARISAVEAERAALSHRRSGAGQPDLRFERKNLQAYKDAGSFERIVQVAGEDLDEDERTYFIRAACGKLLRLAVIRSYRLSLEDVSFIDAHLLSERRTLGDADWRDIRWSAARLAVKALERGDFKVARRLWPSSLTMAMIYLARASRSSRLPKPVQSSLSVLVERIEAR